MMGFCLAHCKDEVPRKMRMRVWVMISTASQMMEKQFWTGVGWGQNGSIWGLLTVLGQELITGDQMRVVDIEDILTA